MREEGSKNHLLKTNPSSHDSKTPSFLFKISSLIKPLQFCRWRLLIGDDGDNGCKLLNVCQADRGIFDEADKDTEFDRACLCPHAAQIQYDEDEDIGEQ